MFNRKIKFAIIITLQILALAGIILFKNSILFNGTEIFLRIEPVDPKDLLRGDYMTFRFADLSRINFYYGEWFNEGESIYVPIYKEDSDKFWKFDGRAEMRDFPYV